MKFERGISPKKVLDIGMESELQDFLKSINQRSDKIDHQLTMAVIHLRKELVQYLIGEGAKPRGEHLQIAVNRKNKDIVKIISDSNPSLKSSLYLSKYRLNKMDPEIVKLIK